MACECVSVPTAVSERLTTPVGIPPLREIRRAKGISLRVAASRAQIDPAHLSRVERGARQLSVDALHRLALVLEISDLAEALEPYVQTPPLECA
jgi:transcriptional regulator with XRE-family HTH domain